MLGRKHSELKFIFELNGDELKDILMKQIEKTQGPTIGDIGWPPTLDMLTISITRAYNLEVEINFGEGDSIEDMESS